MKNDRGSLHGNYLGTQKSRRATQQVKTTITTSSTCPINSATTACIVATRSPSFHGSFPDQPHFYMLEPLEGFILPFSPSSSFLLLGVVLFESIYQKNSKV